MIGGYKIGELVFFVKKSFRKEREGKKDRREE